MNQLSMPDDQEIRDAKLIADLHKLLFVCNGFIVLILASFMCLTQKKIVQSMTARTFLENVSAPPSSSIDILIEAVLIFSLLIVFSRMYRRENRKHVRHILITLEVAACVMLMHSLNLSYDGIVLLVAADLMYQHEGDQLEYMLLTSMIGLYLVADYNLAIFQVRVIPFEVYLSYYNVSTQAVFVAAKNLFYSINIVIFVFYLVMIVKNKHEEKERVRQLNDQLAEANQKLRTYAIETEQIAETRERNRLAREIHDTIGHALTGIVAGLDACIMTIDTAPDFVRQQLTKIRAAAQRGIVDVRRSVKKLRSDDLENLPFDEAVVKMINEFAASSGMKIDLIVDTWPELRQYQEEVIYRVMQESLTNSKRHGRAAHVQIKVLRVESDLRIIIDDDGVGCDSVNPGFGLRHMRERVELLHGYLGYWSDAGFIVEVSIPLNQQV